MSYISLDLSSKNLKFTIMFYNPTKCIYSGAENVFEMATGSGTVGAKSAVSGQKFRIFFFFSFCWLIDTEERQHLEVMALFTSILGLG